MVANQSDSVVAFEIHSLRKHERKHLFNNMNSGFVLKNSPIADEFVQNPATADMNLDSLNGFSLNLPELASLAINSDLYFWKTAAGA